MKSGFRVSVENVCHSYGRTEVLVDVSLTVDVGAPLAIVGGNGVGKSTLTAIIAGLLPPSQGRTNISPVGTAEGRRDVPVVAFLHQNYRQSNLPWRTALGNVTYPLHFQSPEKTKAEQRALGALREFLPEIDPLTRVHRLSGGQQQLVALARAKASEPDLIVADEPLSGADTVRALTAVMTFARDLMGECTSVWVSHKLEEALLIGDRIALLSRRERGIARIVANPLPRPRTLESLNAPELVQLRKDLLEFLISDSPVGRHD